MSELFRLPSESGATSAEPSYETINYHIERARHLRNEEMARILATAVSATRRLIDRLLHATPRRGSKIALS